MNHPRQPRGSARVASVAIACLLLNLWSTDASGQSASATSVPRGPATDLARAVDSLVRDAASTSPSVRALRTAVDVARARASAAGRRDPVTLSAGLSEAPYYALDQGNLRLELGRELGGAGRLRTERLLAEVEVREREVVLDATLRAMRAGLIASLVQMVTEQRVVERLSAENALLEEAEEGLRSRFAVGQARYVDVLRVRTERLRVQSERAETIAALRASRAKARLHLGADAPAGATRLALADSLVSTVDLAAWRALLPQTLDVRELEAASAGIQLAAVAMRRAEAERARGVASRKPRIEAYAGAQRIGQASRGAAFGPSIGFSISLPRTAAAAIASASLADSLEVARASAAQVATSAVVRADLDAAMEHYAAALERMDAFDAALLTGARAEREGALAAYRTQQLSLIELLDFERALARADIDALRALADAAEAYTTLISGGIEPEFGVAPSPDSLEER